jgi:hypothetical protein
MAHVADDRDATSEPVQTPRLQGDKGQGRVAGSASIGSLGKSEREVDRMHQQRTRPANVGVKVWRRDGSNHSQSQRGKNAPAWVWWS